VAALEELVLTAYPAFEEKPFAVHTSAYLAGLDFPREEETLHAALSAREWSDTLTVGNDTLALLRAGSAGVGVAVVCGAGINGAGVGPGGRVARFRARGQRSGARCGGSR